MRNLSGLYCFNKSHILEEGTQSQVVDHARQPILENSCLKSGITRGIGRLGHNIMTTRFWESTTYAPNPTENASTAAAGAPLPLDTC